MSATFTLPSPFAEFEHTADVGVEVEGASVEEVFARAALAMAQLQSGGAPIPPVETRAVEASGDDRVTLLVDVCRQTLARFFDEGLLLAEVAFERLDDATARMVGRFGRFDGEAHGEGLDLKAVTYACAQVREVTPGRWRATLVFDI